MIDIFVESRYRINRKKIREAVNKFLKKNGISPELYDLSVAIVGDRKMSAVHEKYKGKKGTTPVLAFPIAEKTNGRNSRTLLGEVVISYPQTIIFASEENKLIDTKISEFVEHGLTKLLT